MRSDPERRARRLMRAYPSTWRARYGEEFAQLLIDDIRERPHAPSRTADVLRSGLLARLAGAGLTGDGLSGEQQVRTGLAMLGVAAAVFVAAGVSIWSQLTIGWQWSAPASPMTRAAMLMMSASIAVIAVLAAAAALPVLAAVARELGGGRGRRLGLPLLAFALGGAVLVTGSIHFGHGWPGTGGHPWAGRDIVPGAVARASWAATLWITSYWAHPGALASFPAAEVAWMLGGPLALLTTVGAAAVIWRRVPLSDRVLRWEAWLALAAALTMATFLAGASCWVISGGPAPRGLFRVGVIDVAAIVVMAAALILGFRAAQRAHAADPSRPAA